MAKFYIDVECFAELQELEEYKELHGKRLVLRGLKAYINDPISSDRKVEAHAGQAFYINYPELDHMKHLKRGLGLVTTISDNPPQLNWLYADKDTHEVKYGNRTESCEHAVGPWDWRDDETTITLERKGRFLAVKGDDGSWEVYFDRHRDGLQGVLQATGEIGQSGRCAYSIEKDSSRADLGLKKK